MLVSILDRISGDGMAIVGLSVLLWWLGAIASGPEAYATFQSWMWADLATLSFSGIDALYSIIKILLKVVVVGLSWAFFTHLCSGLRHFVLDMGAGYELDGNKIWSIVSPILAILLTAAFWAAVLYL